MEVKNQFPVKPPHLCSAPDYKLLAKDVCLRYPDKAEQFIQDKSVLGFLAGIIMKESKGVANPRLVVAALKRQLLRFG